MTKQSTLLAVLCAVAVLTGCSTQASSSALPSGAPSAVTGASPTPEPTLNRELLGQRLTVLFIGTDSNAGRRERDAPVNADALLLGSVSADQSEVALISLPRDTTGIPLPDGSVWQQKVNAIYALEGPEALVAALEELFGVPIDAYAEIDMDDFVTVVDAVGGVTVEPPRSLDDTKIGFAIEAGRQELGASRALGYVRSRAVDFDYGRAGRQQEVLLELARRLLSDEADVDVAGLLDGLSSFRTSLPLEDLPTLVEIVGRAQDAEVTRQVLGPPRFIVFEGDRGDGRGYILEPDAEAMRRFVQRTIGDE